MKTVTKTLFVTSDGKEFTDEMVAAQHEAEVQVYDSVRKYVDITWPDLSQKGKTKRINELLAYEGYRLMVAEPKVKAA